MKTENDIPKRFKGLYRKLRSVSLPYKVIFFIVGIASTAWFLVRVIPKPSRAGYPCMRAAAPFMSSFVIYLLSITASTLLFKRARYFFCRTRYLMAGVAFLAALAVFAISSNLFSSRSMAAPATSNADYVANQPFGEGAGIFPGRVVWAWDPEATDENCTNVMDDPVRGEDGYFLAKNNNQQVIDGMLADVVRKITGTYTVASAWDLLFKDFNEGKGKGSTAYQPGEKIFVKINQGGGGWLTNPDLTFKVANWTEKYYGMAETSPAIVISLLDQLVNEAGVDQEDIYVGDPIAHIYQHNYEQMVAAFPDVKYVDKDHSDLGRTRISESAEPAIAWSDKGEVMSQAGFDYLYAEMENAEYMINVAALKAHARAGITLTTKNHFGSHSRSSAEHLHPALIAPENDQPVNTGYGYYRVLTDIMGHEKLGGNTLLFIVDGLWGGTEAVEKPVKWNSAPFNGDWPNSILASQDQVALESVCFDLLRNEFTDPAGPGRARPLMGAVDDHLHQAADSSFWAEGIVYDPEGDGTPIGSLGVHEHWNNQEQKQYSRNLGFDEGIELLSTDASLVERTMMAMEAGTAPLVDGDASDECWTEAAWYPIDQTWINWGEEIDSADYFGRFKVSWSESENLVYFLVEITDDAFVDGYVFPEGGYPDFDIVEVFLDEDRSGGLHVFDDNATWGANSENAFSYHLAVDAPEEGEVNQTFVACDIDGNNWPATIMDYAGHFPELAMKKTGNRYHYEFSMKVYSDLYDHADPEASRVTLTDGKAMGMSLAYCDNDTPGTERDNFFGSVWVPEEEYNDHWMNADGYGSVRLIKEGTSVNQAVELAGSIPDFEVTETGTDLVVHANLEEVFHDPDGDPVTYTVQCDDGALTFSVTDHVLTVNASADFSGEATAEVVASDGQSEVSDQFLVSMDVTGLSDPFRNEPPVACYPNPFNDMLRITLKLGPVQGSTGALHIYALNGARMVSRSLNNLSGDPVHLDLNLEEHPAGSYVLEVVADEQRHTLLIHKK
jgi:hypothetical protein